MVEPIETTPHREREREREAAPLDQRKLIRTAFEKALASTKKDGELRRALTTLTSDDFHITGQQIVDIRTALGLGDNGTYATMVRLNAELRKTSVEHKIRLTEDGQGGYIAALNGITWTSIRETLAQVSEPTKPEPEILPLASPLSQLDQQKIARNTLEQALSQTDDELLKRALMILMDDEHISDSTIENIISDLELKTDIPTTIQLLNEQFKKAGQQHQISLIETDKGNYVITVNGVQLNKIAPAAQVKPTVPSLTGMTIRTPRENLSQPERKKNNKPQRPESKPRPDPNSVTVDRQPWGDYIDGLMAELEFLGRESRIGNMLRSFVSSGDYGYTESIRKKRAEKRKN